MQQQDSFQAAIDYLIANRKKPVFTNRGLFTEPAQPDQPAPATKPSVMSGLFGDEYIRKPQDRDSGNYDQPFTGNPFSSPQGGLSSLNRSAQFQNLASSLRGNPNAVGGIASLLTGNPVVGVVAKYGLPKLFDYLGDRAYNQYGQEMQQIGGELFNPTNPNLAALAYNDPNYDAYRSDFPTGGVTYSPGSPATFYNDPNYDAYRSDANVTVGGPVNTSPLQGTSLDFGGTDYSSSVGADAPGTDYSGYSAADLGL
jgi:hypothetical protein